MKAKRTRITNKSTLVSSTNEDTISNIRVSTNRINKAKAKVNNIIGMVSAKQFKY